MSDKKVIGNVNLKDKKEIEAFTMRLLDKMEKENKTLQEVLKISDSSLEEFYAIAHSHYTQGKYKEALHFFRILANFAPKNSKFLLGLASCFYQLESYENAAIFFSLTLCNDHENALAAYYASDCFYKRGEIPAAIECLNLAIEIVEDKKEQHAFKEKCLLIRKSLELKK